MGNAHSDTKPHATKQQRHNPRPVAFMAQAHTPGEDNFYQRKSPGLVLFVCTSNTCRSPMAEFAARKWFAERFRVPEAKLTEATGWEVRSGGLTDEYEPPGSPASANGVAAMKRHGVHMASHRSRLLSASDLEAAKYIFCVTERHKAWIGQVAPEVAGRVETMGKDIPDPWHQEESVYNKCADRIMWEVPKLMEKHFGSSVPEERHQ
uniref:acid phosphatase n=1 Tax=Hemiselmis andersenii TaxID=464988 RepID=A0A6U4NPW2_HEMAN|mmetsp:Transcript_37235/g.87300  ORF Transcript_37235/g.87300 Transcript_37235/m.87300 type:complete len:207 (+) Transcript_37235:468-1088(+)